MSGTRRPRLSAHRPNASAPTGRAIRVSVVAKRDLGFGGVEGLGDVGEHEYEQEVVERVHRPAQPGRDERVALLAGEPARLAAHLVQSEDRHAASGEIGRRYRNACTPIRGGLSRSRLRQPGAAVDQGARRPAGHDLMAR
jgi:hypothetical protein